MLHLGGRVLQILHLNARTEPWRLVNPQIIPLENRIILLKIDLTWLKNRRKRFLTIMVSIEKLCWKLSKYEISAKNNKALKRKWPKNSKNLIFEVRRTSLKWLCPSVTLSLCQSLCQSHKKYFWLYDSIIWKRLCLGKTWHLEIFQLFSQLELKTTVWEKPDT